MARYCQRCGKNTVKGTARFCSAEHRREDHNERKREDRKRAIAAARKLLRTVRGCECPNCDGSCKRKRGRPAKAAHP
ncbi:MAG: hypothetical protein BGO25_05765 [Acidobacteriales bacterium 59-55]|nr:MAG: hypothetical protein ABT04_02540 [Granulicella sp. SCN 62-9]OJV44590.1 MAG: hypothetical protein BGO25_05765 [Acidobacteriales bacterium 59-55]